MRYFSTLLLVALLESHSAFAVTSSAVFAKYRNKYFVETGTCDGEGVQKALDAGFEEVYSIELSPVLYEFSKERFKDKPNVHLILGDSSQVLWEVIQKLDGPITFWLDGHYSGGVTARGASMTALRREIHAIKKHPIKSHTILIDDVRDLGTQSMDFMTLKKVVQKIKAINKKYKISFENGVIKNDVLVAKVK